MQMAVPDLVELLPLGAMAIQYLVQGVGQVDLFTFKQEAL
jgi:hypothetical protein